MANTPTSSDLSGRILTDADHILLAQLVRSGVAESWHKGVAALMAPDGNLLEGWGKTQRLIYPRSSVKMLQATAVRRAGLRLTGPQLAMSSASHSGTAAHVKLVGDILNDAGLTFDALKCPPDYPINIDARISAKEERCEYNNCSGKHSAFLACCAKNGWDCATYLDPKHPLQCKIIEVFEELAGEKILHSSIDGCGAPLHMLTVEGLARAVGRIASQEQDLTSAMISNGWAVGDHGKIDCHLLDSGILAKTGAEGVFVVGLRSGHGLCIKIADGSLRAAAAIAVCILAKHHLVTEADAARLRELVSPTVTGGGAVMGHLEVLV